MCDGHIERSSHLSGLWEALLIAELPPIELFPSIGLQIQVKKTVSRVLLVYEGHDVGVLFDF